MITFYGRHYMAYFYSDKFNTWAMFDDENIRPVGNFRTVMQKCVNGRQ